ncbi:unnamed protein product [Phytophthora lilii]|uniref:Unnamed protein product n=1 Tax=Phytophthora lilii TaxID=2077276 RepID=A0A9W6TK16_9STRA|nr:unnamed protein product [Phytophthora lilii]
MIRTLSSMFRVKFTATAMKCAAANGHLNVVEWLHRNRTEKCTTKAMDEAATNGHLNVVEWLHKNRSEGCTKAANGWCSEEWSC